MSVDWNLFFLFRFIIIFFLFLRKRSIRCGHSKHLKCGRKTGMFKASVNSNESRKRIKRETTLQQKNCLSTTFKLFEAVCCIFVVVVICFFFVVISSESKPFSIFFLFNFIYTFVCLRYKLSSFTCSCTSTWCGEQQKNKKKIKKNVH